MNIAKRILSLVFGILLIATQCGAPFVRASGLPDCQKTIFEDHIGYFDCVDCSAPATDTAAADLSSGSGSSLSGSKMYVIGDSLTVGMRDSGDLKNKLQKAGWTVTGIDATDSISIDASIPIVQANQNNVVGSADVVLVGLGTNPSTDPQAKIQAMIDAIRIANPKAQIVWTNAYSSQTSFDSFNKTLDGFHSSGKIQQILDWAGEAKSNPSKYNLDSSQGIHPDTQGYMNRVDWLVGAIGQAGGTGGATNGVSFNDSQSSDTGGQTTIDDDGIDPSPTGSSNHQGSTSYADGKLGALHTNYFALNPGWASANGLVLGDVAALTYKGKTIYAVYGDNHTGNTVHAEISVKAATALSGVTDPAKVGNLSGVHTVVYPNTRQKLNGSVDQSLIDQIGAQASGAGSPSGGSTSAGSGSGASSDSSTQCCQAGSPSVTPSSTPSPTGGGATSMYDSTDPATIPAKAQVIASYVDAFYANSKDAYTQMKEKFPNAAVISINEHPGSYSPADIWGIEQGSGKTVSATIDAIASGKVHGVYGSQSDLTAVKNGLTAKGVARSSYVLWLWAAGTEGQSAIPAGFDAKQYKITPGYDESTISSTFLNTIKGSSGGGSSAGAGSLTSLTGDAKISGTFAIGFFSTTPKSTIEDIFKKYRPAGFVMLGPTQDAAGAGFNKAFFDQLAQDAGHKIMTASDEEGVFHRYAYSSSFPDATTMGKMSDSQVQSIGADVGKTLANDGINTDLAPVLDVAQDPSGTDATTAGRAFSDNPDVVTSKAGAFAAGLQSSGVNPTYKHFPGIGSRPNANTDTSAVTTDPLAQLKAKDLKPYEALANKNKAAVMMDNAHIPGLTTGNEVAGTSPAAVNLLRNDYKFSGLIMSDSLDGTTASGAAGEPLPAAITDSLKAGVNMPLINFAYTNTTEIDAAISAVKSANIDTSQSLQHIDDFLGTTTPTSTGPSSLTTCCPTASGGGSTQLSGNTPSQQVWNFFSGKGLNNTIVAAIMGNLQVESASSFNPNIYEVNHHSNDPAGAGSWAWGLAQWLPATKIIGIQQAAIKAGTSGANGPLYDLGVQLNIIWWEASTNHSPSGGWDFNTFKANTDVGVAATYWQNHFEGAPGQGDATRQAYSHAWLTYANGGGSLPAAGNTTGLPSGGSSGSGTTGSTGSTGATGSTGSTGVAGSGSSCGSPAAASDTGATGGLTNPFPGGWTPGRLDMGYDGTFKGQVVAPFSGTITYAAKIFSNWGGYIELKADQKPSGLPTSTLYFAEQLKPAKGIVANPSKPIHVNAGDPIADVATPNLQCKDNPGCIEWGVAQDGLVGQPSDTYTKVPGNGSSAARQSVLDFVKWVGQISSKLVPPSSTGNAGSP